MQEEKNEAGVRDAGADAAAMTPETAILCPETDAAADRGIAASTAETIRNHKDTVFRMLFREKKNLLELYNALNGTAHTDETALAVYTLENSIYMNVKNDVSLLFDGELCLFEHQASVNPNLPLRDLSYVTRQLERYTEGRSLYGRRLVRIPEPRFVVFYNGVEEQPEQSVLRLSDSFLKRTRHPELELKVRILNVNYGKNRELMERCRTLEGYSILVARIRANAKELPMGEAVDRAVTECIRENILADFLTRQRAEVKAMSIFEYDEARERKLLQESYLEEGIEIGMEKGIKQGILATLTDLVRKQVISIRDAAGQAGLSEDEFARQMLQYGAKRG